MRRRGLLLLLLAACVLLLASCRIYESEEDQVQYERGGLPEGRYHEWDTDGWRTGTGP